MKPVYSETVKLRARSVSWSNMQEAFLPDDFTPNILADVQIKMHMSPLWHTPAAF